jgi:hypothetical protein
MRAVGKDSLNIHVGGSPAEAALNGRLTMANRSPDAARPPQRNTLRIGTDRTNKTCKERLA